MKFSIPTVPQIKTAFAENKGLVIQKVATVGGVVFGLVVAGILVKSETVGLVNEEALDVEALSE